jgi:putative radical SAM enzyme (TIGR03279 family)
MSHPTVLEVVPGSPADAAGLQVGDGIIAVNGVVPTDVIEYQQLIDDPDPALTVLRGDAEVAVVLDKVAGERVGLRLNASIFDRVQTCDNHCEFCFIYQLPPGMRKTLYLKDDDYRLSFLYGNFTTLTRFTELDLARVVEERLGPLYVSIHATDPEIRSRMLRNPRGGTSLRWLRALLANGVTVHGQVVLCPGINNGAVLARTAAEILTRYPKLATVGIVPLGLSRYNTEENLYPHTEEEAAADLSIVHFWQERALEMLGRRMFFASDELYLRAGSPIPEGETYEGYAQHENGIGMVRAFYDELAALLAGDAEAPPVVSGEWRTIPSAPAEFYRAQKHPGADPEGRPGPVAILTGSYGATALRPVLGDLELLAERPLRLLSVRNDFFGGNTGVAGLLTGSDVMRAIAADATPAGRYLVPDVALSGDTFLDDVTLAEVRAVAPAPLIVATTTAGGLLEGARR